MSVAVTNQDAARPTDEVVLVFFSPVVGTIPSSAPAAALRRTLIGFERLGPIAPGMTVRASFVVPAVPFHDAEGHEVFYDGQYEVTVSTGRVGHDVVLPCRCSTAWGCHRA